MNSRIAVVYVHGIGLQDRYEGLSEMSQCLEAGAERAGWKVDTNSVEIPKRRFKSVEVVSKDARSKKRIDIYEAYWAPHFNGATTTLSVSRWLALVLRKFAGLLGIAVWGLVTLLWKFKRPKGPPLDVAPLDSQPSIPDINLRNYRAVHPHKALTEILLLFFTVSLFGLLLHHSISLTLLAGSQLVKARQQTQTTQANLAAPDKSPSEESRPATIAAKKLVPPTYMGYNLAKSERFFLTQTAYQSPISFFRLYEYDSWLKNSQEASNQIIDAKQRSSIDFENQWEPLSRYHGTHRERLECFWLAWKAAWVTLFQEDRLPDISFQSLQQSLSVRDVVAGVPWVICFFLFWKNFLDWLSYLPGWLIRGVARKKLLPSEARRLATRPGSKRTRWMFLGALLSLCGWIGLSLFNSLAVQMFLGALAFVQLERRWLDKVLIDILGDIEIYSTRHESENRFKARESALSEVRQQLCEILSQPGEYDAVFLVGHSLGSCLALDTLRRLHADHNQGLNLCNPQGIEGWETLRGFVTYGSPLVKMRLFFDQRDHKSDFAEWNIEPDKDLFVAANKRNEDQTGNTRIPWKNFWFEFDIICNPLSNFGFQTEDVKLASPLLEIWPHSSYLKEPRFQQDFFQFLVDNSETRDIPVRL